MKKTISIFAFLLAFTTNSFAQGNLQFNQVINGNTAPVTFNYATQTLGTIVVPAGKVWKIEGTTYTRTNSGDTGTLAYYVFIDRHVAWTGWSANNQKPNFPLWLPAGTFSHIQQLNLMWYHK